MTIITKTHPCGCKVDRLIDPETGDLIEVEVVPCDDHLDDA